MFSQSALGKRTISAQPPSGTFHSNLFTSPKVPLTGFPSRFFSVRKIVQTMHSFKTENLIVVLDWRLAGVVISGKDCGATSQGRHKGFIQCCPELLLLKNVLATTMVFGWLKRFHIVKQLVHPPWQYPYLCHSDFINTLFLLFPPATGLKP